MTKRTEPLDIQLRRARMRRDAIHMAWFAGIATACGIAFSWLAFGWRWSYLVVAPVAIIAASWIGYLLSDAEEELTRWFWRPPR